MNSINKTISMQKKVTVKIDEVQEVDLAFLNCQIGTEYNTFSINVQIINKNYYDLYQETLKEEYRLFRMEVEKECVKYGWNIF